MNLDLEIGKYKFKVKGKVRFAEVDSASVVHNIQYLFWTESARTEYFSNLGIEMHPNTFIHDYPLMVVHHTIDYFDSAKFGENYQVLSKISQVKNSSLKFENLVISENNRLLVSVKSVFVHLNNKTKQPERIPENLREKIKEFEGEDVEFIND